MYNTNKYKILQKKRHFLGASCKKYLIQFMVPVEGLEPSRVLPHRILSPTRLPIPPHWQVMQNNNIKLLALLQDIIIHFLNHYHYSSLDTLT